MSMIERRRMAVLVEVKAGRMKLVDAVEAMGLGCRQAKRVWKRYKAKGHAEIVGNLGVVGEQLAHPRAAFAVLGEFEDAGSDREGGMV